MAKKPAAGEMAPAYSVEILDAKCLRGPVPEGAGEGEYGPVIGYQVEHRSELPCGSRKATEMLEHPEGREEPLNAEELKAEIARLYTGA